MYLRDRIPDRYKRVARCVGYSLLTGTPGGWHGLSVVLTARLAPEERAALAWSVLRALPPDHVIATANAVLPEAAGMPVAPLFNPMDEASFWADMASGDELEAYCLACFNRMAPGRQMAFLEFVQLRDAA